MNVILAGILSVTLLSCAQAPPDTTLVVSSDPELRRLASELLPDLADRAGLELREPVRLERRTRAELERYLRAQLDEELPVEEEVRLRKAYALLGMVPEDLDLRALLLSVYTEQVAGFYDPDSTALFVMDDQSPEVMTGLLVHELVHAVQDQATNLDSVTHRDRGNDRQTAAQAAIEGHATLVMLEQMMEEMRGGSVDLSEVPDFSSQLRPALESIRSQYPALGGAPRVIQETILFPYLEGAGFVQRLWSASDGRPAPFGENLPQSTEQVMDPSRFVGSARDRPTEVTLTVHGRDVLDDNTLGQLETRIFVEELTGTEEAVEVRGWDGDRYVLLGGTEEALAWVVVWDDAEARDRFVDRIEGRLDALPRPASIEVAEVEGRPVSVLRVGRVGEVDVTLGDDGG